ncbi:MAG: DUF2163 domain-containing protein [Alphaproteobacteria bacterium]|nr:DUF2163 domain-containing protein [Alphaproteobacteria bacterium]
MKSASTALINYLNTGKQFIMSDLYTITLVGGSVLRYCDADISITYGGNLFSKFNIARDGIKTSIGVQVDEVKITVNPSSSDLINGQPWGAAVWSGALDGAQVKLERLFMPTWGDTSLGTIVMFSGHVSQVTPSRTEIGISVKSELELFDTQIPRDMFQSGCLNTLYDPICSLNKASFAVTGTVASSGLLSTVTVVANMSQADGYFSLGTIQFTSGANSGLSRSVRTGSASSGVTTFALMNALPNVPAAGDTFTAWPGCDKLQSTCTGKFSNVVNFRGFPYVPSPETAT